MQVSPMSTWSDKDGDGAPGLTDEASLALIEYVPVGRYPVIKATDVAPSCPPAIDGTALGSDEPLRFSTAEAIQPLTLALIGRARRSLCIFTPDLEHWLYDNGRTYQACLSFLLQYPECRLRILIVDPTAIVRRGHRLLTLFRRLPSRMQIRRANPDHPAGDDAYLLCDESAYLWRPDAREHVGVAYRRHPARARQLRTRFDDAWKLSPFDANLRSLLL